MNRLTQTPRSRFTYKVITGLHDEIDIRRKLKQYVTSRRLKRFNFFLQARRFYRKQKSSGGG